MDDAAMHVQSDDAQEERQTGAPPRGRVRTCVGCGERVDMLSAGDGGGDDLVRLVLGPEGEIAVDPKGGGFGRGAHVHARRACLERAAKAGLLRATKGAARVVCMPATEDDAEGAHDGATEALSADALARAIQRSMDRRIRGLFSAAIRSRQVAIGSDAVTDACHRGEAELVLVACDAAAAADLTEVRRAVAEGRGVAWGSKERLGAIVSGLGSSAGGVAPAAVRARLGAPQRSAPSFPEGVGVVAIASQRIAGALRQAVRASNAVAAGPGGARHEGAPKAPKPAPEKQARDARPHGPPGRRPGARPTRREERSGFTKGPQAAPNPARAPAQSERARRAKDRD